MTAGVRSRRPGARRTARRRGEAAFREWVRRSDDQRLERVFGTDVGLRLLFGALGRRLPRDRVADLTGEVCFALRTAQGEARPWTLRLTPDGVDARAGVAVDPHLTVRLPVADLVRIAAGELDADEALLTGRMDLAGDAILAARLGELLRRG